MKKYRILNFIILFSLFGFLLTGCDENMPVIHEIGVEGLTLNEELVGGLTLEKGTTAEIKNMVSLTPVNATDRAENYSSSNPEIATVSGLGIVTANEAGTCDIIITVGGKSVQFPLTVTPIVIIPIEEIILAVKSPFELKFDETFDLASQVGVDPINSNDELIYTSSNPEIVTVNSAGLIKSVDFGQSTITVSAKSNPLIKAELIVNVGKLEYDRTGWIVTPSHGLPIQGSEQNKPEFAVDGSFSTVLSMVRPNKAYGSGSNRITVAIDEAIHFTVDMLEKREINYFRIRHKNTSEPFIRWFGFDKIEGSNDGVNFTVIAENVAVTNANVSVEIETPDILLPKSEYRYIKFTAKEAKCFNGSSYTSQGSTVQIAELYFGLGKD